MCSFYVDALYMSAAVDFFLAREADDIAIRIILT